MAKQPCVYIITNHRHGTLYIGVTSDLRIACGNTGRVSSTAFRAHGLKLLVWYELHDEMETAIVREKRLRNGTTDGRSSSSRK